MRHLIICPEYPPSPEPVGGIGTYVMHISRLLAEAGETVHLIGMLWGSGTKKLEVSHEGRLIIHRVSLDEVIPDTRTESYPPLALAEIKGLAESPFWQQSFSWQAGLLTEKLIIEANIDIIEAQDYFAPLYYFQLRRALGLGPARQPPCIVHLHTPSSFAVRFNDWNGGRPFWLNAKRLEDYSIAAADAWLCPSNFLACQMESLLGLESNTINVIHLPIGDTPQLHRTGEVWNNGSICYVGRLEPRKGVIEWVDAVVSVADRFPAAQFDFIGEDMEYSGSISVRQFVEKRIPFRMRSRFQFHGKRSRIELMGLLGKARIGVVPSRWENFPNTCVEMMCSGLPVIATRMGGMAEMINDNKSGWLSNSPRPDDLADALTRALEVSPSRLAEMGNQAVLDIRSICDNKKIVDLHLELRRRIAIEGVKRSFRIPPNLPWANRNPSDESVRRYPKDTSPKGIAVVIDGLNFNGDLSHCLRGIKRQIRPPVAVVLLVESKQDEKLKDIIQDAQLPELSVCEVEDHSSPVVKNHGIQYVLSSGANPIGFVFLDSRDLLYAGFIETTESALENCPDVGLVSSWMQIVGEGYKVSVSPCPAFPYQLLDNETIPATVIRTEAIQEVGLFRREMTDGFEQWDLINAVMTAGWIAITFPELLSDHLEKIDSPTVVNRKLRGDLLSRNPEIVIRDAIELIQLLESRIQWGQTYSPGEDKSAFHIVRPRDVFKLTLEQQVRVVLKVLREPKSAVKFIMWHVKNNVISFGIRISGRSLKRKNK